MLHRFQARGYHQLVEPYSPPCLAVQVVDAFFRASASAELAAGGVGGGFVAGFERHLQEDVFGRGHAAATFDAK